MKFNNNHDLILLFEKKLSEFTGAPFVVLVDSATNGIFLTLKLLKYLKEIPSDTIIKVPKHTYISVPQSILHAGFSIEFIDKEWVNYYELEPLKIIDAAVGFDKNIYKPNHYMILSFQQKKTLNIGKGGAILLDDEEKYKILKRMTWDGRDASMPIYKDKNILPPELSYHMNFTPDMATEGILLLNQLTEQRIKTYKKSYKDYSDISCFFKK